MACKYDINVVIPLLMVCFDRSNPTINASIVTTIDVVGLNLEEICLVWVLQFDSIEESSLALVN